MPARDERWLQQRYRTWYCVLEIPRSLRSEFGKRRLIESLHTDDHTLAIARRHAVLAKFHARLDEARRRMKGDPVIRAALEWREHAGRQTSPDDQLVAQWDIDTSADAIADPGQRETFLAIAYGRHTPFESFLDQWLSESDIEERSKGDHRRAAKELIAWAAAEHVPPTIEGFDRRTAGRYVSHLLSGNLDRQKTVSKRLWSLSSLWRWLIAKGFAEQNVWTGHSIGNGRSARDKTPERPFTTDELTRLLSGPADPVLHDLMRLALLSGARLEELALLRVSDITPAEQTMHVQADPKTPASRRMVPIHSAVWPMVEARILQKLQDAFLFHELGPAPKPGRQRSMPISKAFGRYRVSVGVDDRREGQRRSLTNFHSFRRCFVTLAEQAGIPESTIKSVVGHKRQGMTFGVYSGGPSLEQRRACVEAVQLPNLQTKSP